MPPRVPDEEERSHSVIQKQAPHIIPPRDPNTYKHQALAPCSAALGDLLSPLWVSRVPQTPQIPASFPQVRI